ncbi:MAG: heavy metal translocating P-type ATPase metal-binding domain-containing protein, partial [Rhodospirillales bacterium]|nr:heavy metal translocating P-type ATPase metal-binding domain-containing protein [Rhodospirillales bacterium]
MTACRHCGLEVAETTGVHGADFCCSGCEAAFALIQGAGLGDYYKRRILDPEAVANRPDENHPILDPTPFANENEDGTMTLYLMVEGIYCAACVWLIETVLARCPGVTGARLNMTTRRLRLDWSPPDGDIAEILAAVTKLGYRVLPYDPAFLEQDSRKRQKELLRAMAVAGFAAANVMVLSVSVWSGAGEGQGGGSGPATRTLMHWFSALIALPAIAYAGRPFFRSAFAALRRGSTNMDVPISLAVILTAGMSLFETIRGGSHVYFESATMLLFFLLIGRYLDLRARGHAHAQAERLTSITAGSVTVLNEDGTRTFFDPRSVQKNMTVLVAAGERIAVDGVVLDGVSELDCSLITGESLPVGVKQDDLVYAGTLNESAPLRISVTATGEQTLLAEIARMMEIAEQGRGRYVTLSERIARLYAPVVHGVALISFLGWVGLTAMPWQDALLIAASVLIITCPCALALAVPVVHVVAASRLMRRGVLIKSGTALERLAKTDSVVFDKTGTLTTGTLQLSNKDAIASDDLGLAAAIAANSSHPLARALSRLCPGQAPRSGVSEIPGAGLILENAGGEIRLGRRDWCGVPEERASGDTSPELWLARPGAPPVQFRFADPLRPDVADVIAQLKAEGMGIALLSGDRSAAVSAVAGDTGISDWKAAQSPGDKVRYLQDLTKQGHATLMV